MDGRRGRFLLSRAAARQVRVAHCAGAARVAQLRHDQCVAAPRASRGRPLTPSPLLLVVAVPSWYDLKGLGDRDAEDCDGIDDTRAFLTAQVQAEIDSGLDPSRIVLSGFSQGGACSLYTGLQLDVTLGGILVKSGYLPRPAHVAGAVTDAAKRTPVLMLHGDDDPMVLLKWAEASRDAVKAMGVEVVDFKTYEGLQHSANIDELTDATGWLVERVGASKAGGAGGASAL